MRTLIPLAALLLALPAAAQVNKCVIDGKTVYQAAPCPQGAKAATLKYRHDIAEDDAKAAREDFLAREKARQTADRRLSIEREMSALERQIERYQKDMDAELAALRNAKGAAANNLAGATWEQSLSTEMQAVTTKYQTKIKIAQDKIATLREELKALPK